MFDWIQNNRFKKRNAGHLQFKKLGGFPTFFFIGKIR